MTGAPLATPTKQVCRALVALVLVALALLSGACGSGATEMPRHAHGEAVQKGKASWYGKRFQGRKTASGERFDRHAMTAAHRTLPFGTRVRVTNEDNGKSVVVRINDRGPFGGGGRIIDLSEAAATKLDMKRSGVVRVSVEVLHP